MFSAANKVKMVTKNAAAVLLSKDTVLLVKRGVGIQQHPSSALSTSCTTFALPAVGHEQQVTFYEFIHGKGIY
jgi:hypothetical protein